MNTILLCFLSIFMTEYCYNSLHYYLLNFLTIYISIPSLLLKLYWTMPTFFFLETLLFLTVTVFWIFLFICSISLMGVTHGTLISSFLPKTSTSPSSFYLFNFFYLYPWNTGALKILPFYFILFIYFFFFELEFSLHRPGWPGTCYIARPALKSLASLP